MAITTAPAVPLRRDVDDETDHDLVARVRTGDDRAFERLYRRYHRRIGAYVQSMVHDHARAEDVTQDVFMSALRRMRETDRPIAFKPWIYEIAKNACIDQFRRSRRAEEVSMDAEQGLGSADVGKLVTRDPSPEVAIEHKQSLDHLCGAFGGLSETHHEILVMRELEGLSYREIGERLEMTRPAVESTLFRARRRLTEEYDELVSGERCQRVQGIIAIAVQGSLGARDRRRLSRHVSHCQPCLRHARMSGVESGELVRTPVRARVAALLPLPAFLKQRIAGGEPVGSADVSSLASWSAHVGSFDPGMVSSWGKAAATAATIAIAGVGAGVVTGPDPRTGVPGGSIVEALRADDPDRRAAGRRGAAVASAPTSAPVARQAGRRAAGSTRRAQRAPVGGAGREGAARERATDRDAPRSTSGAAAVTGVSGTSDVRRAAAAATGTATGTTDSGPLGETLTRLGGSGGSAESPGESGGGTSAELRTPSVPRPAMGGETSAGTAQPKSPPTGPGATVEDGAAAVGSTVEGAAGATTGILGGQ